MVPGPTFIHKCTTCGNLLTKQSSRSGNTFGATIYSDGKVIAPSNREFPLITKCSKCEQILWLGGDNYTGIESEYFIREYEGVAVEESRFLTINEYVQAAENGIFSNVHEEIFIRRRIWWEFNHRVQEGSSFFKSESEKLIWLANINRLIEIFDPADVYQRICIAELNRHLGNFEACMEIINNLDDSPEWDRYKAYYAEECEKKSTKVFILDSFFNLRKF